VRLNDVANSKRQAADAIREFYLHKYGEKAFRNRSTPERHPFGSKLRNVPMFCTFGDQLNHHTV
jgi:hypothetical protein